MEVTESGMIRSPVSPLQPEKALPSMVVTESGMVKLVSPLQFRKAP